VNKATEEALRKALESKKKRFDKLDALMSKRHTSQADCKAHDEIAKRFNACKDIDEKMRIAIELKPISDRIKKQFRMSGIQNDNYMKWMGEQDKLRSEIWELENSLSLCDFRRFLSATDKGDSLVDSPYLYKDLKEFEKSACFELSEQSRAVFNYARLRHSDIFNAKVCGSRDEDSQECLVENEESE